MSPLRDAMKLLLLLLSACTTVLAGDVDVPFFDAVVNMSIHSDNQSEFLDHLMEAIGSARDTVFVLSATPLTPQNASPIKSLCVDNFFNISVEEASHLVRYNLTFVGPFDDAVDASRNLEVLSSCRMGIYALNTKTGYSDGENETLSIGVTLVTGVTPGAFVARLASYFKITPTAFVVAADSVNATSSFNMTIVGAHIRVIAQKLLSLTSTQLLSIGAEEVVALTPAAPPPPEDTQGLDVGTVSIIAVVCGLILAFMLVLFVRWNKGDCPVSGEDQKSLNTIRIWRVSHRRLRASTEMSNNSMRTALQHAASGGRRDTSLPQMDMSGRDGGDFTTAAHHSFDDEVHVVVSPTRMASSVSYIDV